MSARDRLRDARRIVVKVGTSTLTHPSGGMNLHRIEHLVRELIDEANQGKEVLLVSSGAIAAGMNTLGLKERPAGVPERQALAAIGQGALLHIYEKFFHEYGRTMAQVLLTKENAAYDAVLIAACNHHRHACILGNLCRLDLRLHSARPLRRSCTAGEALNLRRNLRNLRNQTGRCIRPRIRCIDPVDIGENNERICIDERRNDRGQIVIVADLDLIDSNRVIFIDDRNNVHPKEGKKSIA